jgi:phage terminase large subunit GpA-like protein
MGVADWAARYRYLSPEASAEPGLWRNARAPHAVGPMECLSPYHPAERVVCMWSSQSGKTEVILCFIGFIVDLDPGPILAIQPNVTPMGEAFSKDRVNPMLRDSPTLAAKIGSLRARNSAQTITHKTFPGGHLTIAGANSPAGLASRPIRYLVCDELDRWEITKEGDPLLLARKRLQTFRARRSAKELIVSSPTYADLGISVQYAECTQQHEWRLACLHCGERQLPRLKHFHHDGDPRGLRYICEHCGGEHTLKDEDRVKASGAWIRTRDGEPNAVGWWMNQWASPFARWDDTLREWLDAGDDPARRQVVTNTVFAEPWEGEGERIEPHILGQRAEDYGAEVPADALAITIGADVQGDRVEAEVVAWGPGRESWSIGYHVLPGEPTAGAVWDDLLELYRTDYHTADGRALRAVACCVDSGAYTQHVYEFVKRTRDRGLIPVKGASGMYRDQIAGDERQRRKNAARRVLSGRPPEILGVDALKRTVYHMLAAGKGAAGYCHFPPGRSEEYYLQLTGERLQTVVVRGKRPERRWVPIHPAVEALDCRVYAYAALLLSGVRLERTIPEPRPERPKPAPAPPPPRRSGGYVNRWK